MIRSSSKTRKRRAMILECDKYSRELCFERDGHKCVRCGKDKGIQWAHVISRRHLSTRWDLDNCLTLCAGCHKFWWHDNPREAVEWFAAKFPERNEHIRAIHAMRIKVDIKSVLWGFRFGKA